MPHSPGPLRRRIPVVAFVRRVWPVFLAAVTTMAPTVSLPGQTPGVLSSFRVVDMKDRGEGRAPVVTAIAMHAAKNILATAGDDHCIRLFGAGGEQLLGTWANEGWVYDLSFDPAGTYLASVDEWGVLSLWHWETGKRVYRLPVSSAALRAVAFHPDGTVLAVGGFEPKVELVETLTGRVLQRFHATGRDVRDVAFSPEGRLLAATGGSGHVEIWEIAAQRPVADVAVSPRRQHALAFAPGGRALAVGGEDGMVRVLRMDEASPTLQVAFSVGNAQVTSLVFCDNGRFLAAGTSRNDVQVFDLENGREIARLRGHTGTVARLLWTPGQEVLASASFDTTIRFWRLPTATTLGERPTGGTGPTIRQ